MTGKVSCTFVAILLILGPRICCVISHAGETGTAPIEKSAASTKRCCKGCRNHSSPLKHEQQRQPQQCPCEHWHKLCAEMFYSSPEPVLDVCVGPILELLTYVELGLSASTRPNQVMQLLDDPAASCSNLLIRLSIARC